jgi:hypothetical protein
MSVQLNSGSLLLLLWILRGFNNRGLSHHLLLLLSVRGFTVVLNLRVRAGGVSGALMRQKVLRLLLLMLYLLS